MCPRLMATADMMLFLKGEFFLVSFIWSDEPMWVRPDVCETLDHFWPQMRQTQLGNKCAHWQIDGIFKRQIFYSLAAEVCHPPKCSFVVKNTLHRSKATSELRMGLWKVSLSIICLCQWAKYELKNVRCHRLKKGFPSRIITYM